MAELTTFGIVKHSAKDGKTPATMRQIAAELDSEEEYRNVRCYTAQGQTWFATENFGNEKYLFDRADEALRAHGLR